MLSSTSRIGRWTFFWQMTLLKVIQVVLLTEIAHDRPIPTLAICLLALPFAIVISVRRLRDLGRGGWDVLLLTVPIVGLVVTFQMLFTPGVSQNDESATSSEPSPSSEPSLHTA